MNWHAPPWKKNSFTPKGICNTTTPISLPLYSGALKALCSTTQQAIQKCILSLNHHSTETLLLNSSSSKILLNSPKCHLIQTMVILAKAATLSLRIVFCDLRFHRRVFVMIKFFNRVTQNSTFWIILQPFPLQSTRRLLIDR